VDRQQMSSIINSIRKIMRKDDNLDTDVKRMPMISWMFFLKALDDMEIEKKGKAEFRGEKFYPTIDKPYRWRDWAADESGITGDDLLNFVNNDLLPYLKNISGGYNGGREKIASIFMEVNNEARNGYLLRDALNQINKINFNAADDIHTLSHLYESMLKELRDAAGQNGEFYTPRPVVRFIVEMIDPKIGERVLDPAAGTCGFLVEALFHLEKQIKSVEHRTAVYENTLYAREKKPMPFLLGSMNLILHGIDSPNYIRTNSLAMNLNDITDEQRVDVIITNPPFGGEEEASVQTGFPADKQTAETALLFVQLIMRLLKRPNEKKGIKGGRCGMVVPDEFLYGDGIAARIKEQMLKECNLHTIIRLPEGVFEPYTQINTNLLFFEYGKPTKDIWFYEMPLPEGRKKYVKTIPQRYEEYRPIMEWWKRREENEFAWKVSVSSIIESGFNLDLTNPSRFNYSANYDPLISLSKIISKEKEILSLLENVKKEL